MRRRYTIPLLALLLVTSCVAQRPPAGNAAADVAARISSVETGLVSGSIAPPGSSRFTIEERLRHYAVPGVSVAVINNGRVEWARAWGTVEAGKSNAVDTTTLFQAASISKTLTALAALRMVQDGALQLNEDVNLRLTSWKVPASQPTAVEKVTLARLLSHSAGVTVSGFPGYGTGSPIPTIVQVLRGEAPANTSNVEVDIVPGDRVRYSGGGYTIVQLLISDVTGKPFADVMRDMVLVPAGMSRSTFAQPLPTERWSEAATGHSRTGTAISGRFYTYPELAAAGLWTTPSDLARFAIEVQRAFDGGTRSMLSAGLTRQMLTPRSDDYGLGFAIAGAGSDRWFAHGGSNVGFRSHLVASVHGGRGAIVLTNGDRGFDLGTEVLRAIARTYDWPSHAVD